MLIGWRDDPYISQNPFRRHRSHLTEDVCTILIDAASRSKFERMLACYESARMQECDGDAKFGSLKASIGINLQARLC
jgi:hypothetical protein